MWRTDEKSAEICPDGMAGDEARAGKRRRGDIEQYLGADRAKIQGESPERRQIGNESSAADNAFIYSVIESCKFNDMDSGMYLRHLLNKLKSHTEGDDLSNLLPCYSTL